MIGIHSRAFQAHVGVVSRNRRNFRHPRSGLQPAYWLFFQPVLYVEAQDATELARVVRH